MEKLELSIKEGVDVVYERFLRLNPTIEDHCDKETMKEWYSFIYWCYCQEDNICNWEEGKLIDSDDDVVGYLFKDEDEFIISPLMYTAICEAGYFVEKYFSDHIQVAIEELRNVVIKEKYEDEEEYEDELRIQAEDALDDVFLNVSLPDFKKLSQIIL
jgi:hypothetical protein